MLLRLVSRGEQGAAAADGGGDLKVVIRVPDKQRARRRYPAFSQKIHRIIRFSVREVVAVSDHAVKVAVEIKVRNLLVQLFLSRSGEQHLPRAGLEHRGKRILGAGLQRADGEPLRIHRDKLPRNILKRLRLKGVTHPAIIIDHRKSKVGSVFLDPAHQLHAAFLPHLICDLIAHLGIIQQRAVPIPDDEVVFSGCIHVDFTAFPPAIKRAD